MKILFTSFLLFLALHANAQTFKCEVYLIQRNVNHQKVDTPWVFFSQLATKGQILNDSTYLFQSFLSEPYNSFCLLENTPIDYWAANAWLEKDLMPARTLIVDYQNHKAIVQNLSAWDSLSRQSLDYIAIGNYKAADSIEIAYIKNHPSSFLSLSFIPGLVYQNKRFTVQNLLNGLNPVLIKAYPNAYAKAVASLKPKHQTKAGDSFKEFEAESANGNIFNSAKIQDKWILLDFWHSGCGPCIRGINDFRALYQSIDTSKIEFISINLDNDINAWKNCKIFGKMLWPSVWVPDGIYSDLALQYNVSAYPFFVLFNAKKELDMITFGAEELPLLKKALSAIK